MQGRARLRRGAPSARSTNLGLTASQKRARPARLAGSSVKQVGLRSMEFLIRGRALRRRRLRG